MAESTPDGAGLIRWMFALIDAREWAGLTAVFHPEMTYERPGYDRLVGREAVLHFYREVRVIASGTHHLDSILQDGDAGTSSGRFVGVSRAGEAIEIDFAECYRFRDGKVWARRTYFFVPAV